MTQYSNENSGLLAKNDKQGNESRPDLWAASEILISAR